MHLVGFTIEIYYDARPYECQIYMNSSRFCVDKTNPTTGDKMRAEFYVTKRKSNRNSFLKYVYLTSIATKLTDKCNTPLTMRLINTRLRCKAPLI